MKSILIIGKDSYIGESIFKWLSKYPEKYIIDIVSPLNYQWKKIDFSKFETVVDLAGIAHIMNITDDMKDLFYSVNRDLTIEIGTYAKQHGVRHFIYFSSMNVYGDYCQTVTDRNAEKPTSFYGDSKLQADLGLRKLTDANFILSSVRPPFVYGKGCKGNYNSVSRIAKKIPVFPTYKNKKSMIYIDNLCEFIRLLIENPEGGIFTPQNNELISTYELIKEIAVNSNRKVFFTGFLNWMIKPLMKISKNARKAFSDDCYDLKLSKHFDFKYCVVDFRTSIAHTEN